MRPSEIPPWEFCGTAGKENQLPAIAVKRTRFSVELLAAIMPYRDGELEKGAHSEEERRGENHAESQCYHLSLRIDPGDQCHTHIGLLPDAPGAYFST